MVKWKAHKTKGDLATQPEMHGCEEGLRIKWAMQKVQRTQDRRDQNEIEKWEDKKSKKTYTGQQMSGTELKTETRKYIT